MRTTTAKQKLHSQGLMYAGFDTNSSAMEAPQSNSEGTLRRQRQRRRQTQRHESLLPVRHASSAKLRVGKMTFVKLNVPNPMFRENCLNTPTVSGNLANKWRNRYWGSRRRRRRKNFPGAILQPGTSRKDSNIPTFMF